MRNIVLYIYPEKVLGTAAAQKHQSVFFCEAILFFHISEKNFHYSTCLCFSYSEIFLYRSRFYYFFLFFLQKDFYVVHEHTDVSCFFLLQKDLDLFLKSFFVSFITSRGHFYIYIKNEAIKKRKIRDIPNLFQQNDEDYYSKSRYFL